MIWQQPTACTFAPTGFALPDEGRQHLGPSAISCVYIPLTNFQDCGPLCAARSALRTSLGGGKQMRVLSANKSVQPTGGSRLAWSPFVRGGCLPWLTLSVRSFLAPRMNGQFTISSQIPDNLLSN